MACASTVYVYIYICVCVCVYTFNNFVMSFYSLGWIVIPKSNGQWDTYIIDMMSVKQFWGKWVNYLYQPRTRIQHDILKSFACFTGHSLHCICKHCKHIKLLGKILLIYGAHFCEAVNVLIDTRIIKSTSFLKCWALWIRKCETSKNYTLIINKNT